MGLRLILCLAPALLLALTVTSITARIPEEPSDRAPLVPSEGEGLWGVGRHRPRPLGPLAGSSSSSGDEGRRHGQAEVRPRRQVMARPPWELPSYPASPMDWAERGRRIGDYFRQMRMKRKFGWFLN
ncbi:uncharacterized protein LOC124154135 [Ischnura elegans]|uniref:uncharacterized protein LOC124154135 n=1 Tax=Ischnura elegans TaxID=197161 RepID=UPI001ED88765|nr:uncharacterized protein LOC124154135 [Ischnura elegans]